MKVWDFIVAAKKTFPKIGMAKVESPDIKKMAKLCGEMIPIILHPILYRALKLTYPTDVSEIVLEGRIRSKMGTGTWGNRRGSLTSKFPSSLCLKG